MLLFTYIRMYQVLSKFDLFLITNRQIDVDVKYYADGENGIRMEQNLVQLREELKWPEFKGSRKSNDSSEKTEESSSKKNKKKQSELSC